ncbi:MAG: 5-oxoprolinase subunit PxpB [Acidobacteria bacterium]|nr:5-oxoprolinase subunit PxpB [Acidobacteriota bacterium]
MTDLRIREAGDSALVAELEAVIDPAVNARAIAIAAQVRARRIAGVRDIVSTFHSVAVTFDPMAVDTRALRAALADAAHSVAPSTSGRTIEVPVTYGGDAGPDLADVAAFAGCTPADVIERHASRAYRVYMLGFLPGYPYLAQVDETIAMPRRATPRLRVPAGSVGIAGRQTGIYPRESPGGWQIIGRTSLTLFDPEASSPALLAPGDEVRFVPVSGDVVSDFSRTEAYVASGFSRTQVRPNADATYDRALRYVTVLSPGLLTTIQDEGRWGFQHLGVPVAGPMDPVAHRLANAVLGSPRDAATLEATLAGPELRFEHDAWIAIAGADLQPSVDGRDAPVGTPVRCRAGSVLRFGGRRSGARAYVAIDGGFTVPRLLGSRATHLLSGLGGLEGRALRAGDRLPLGRNHDARPREPEGVAPRPTNPGGARLRILPGPHLDHFAASAVDALQAQRYIVSPQSDRMGYRLTGGARIPAPAGEMISAAVFVGALQVPPSGEPILLMADRQTTGGYPQLAVVIRADLTLAAQLVPGDWVEFRGCSASDALTACRDQEGGLDALG